jgi:hypothetical protein
LIVRVPLEAVIFVSDPALPPVEDGGAGGEVLTGLPGAAVEPGSTRPCAPAILRGGVGAAVFVAGAGCVAAGYDEPPPVAWGDFGDAADGCEARAVCLGFGGTTGARGVVVRLPPPTSISSMSVP